MTRQSTAKVGLLVCALLALAAACSKSTLTNGQVTCSYAGKTYRAGETFPSSDGCNACSCDIRGSVSCTLMACLGDAGFSPPDHAENSDLAPAEVFVSGEDAGPANEDAGDLKPSADAGPDTKPTSDTTVDTRPVPGDSAVAYDVKDTLSTCLWQDASVQVGGSVFDGCNTCVCMNGGAMACTARACMLPDAGKDTCGLTTAIAFGDSGGMVSSQDGYSLDPSTGLTITRDYLRGAVDGATVRTCTPALPACGAAAEVSVSTIVADLADPDVQQAFALTGTPIFGVDERPTDGPIWSISLASGGAVLVGAPCPSPIMDSCRPISPGIQKLTDDLRSLASAASGESACSGL